MAQTTRVHALKVAIADGLAAVPALSGVQVTDYFVGKELNPHESIQLAGDDAIESDWAAIGRRSRDEKITLLGIVTVDTPGSSQAIARATRSRAADLVAEVEKFIVADPTVGSVVLTSKVRPTRLVEGFDDRGRWALFTFEIEALSRLQTS